jgi:hypothetical protein
MDIDRVTGSEGWDSSLQLRRLDQFELFHKSTPG